MINTLMARFSVTYAGSGRRTLMSQSLDLVKLMMETTRTGKERNGSVREKPPRGRVHQPNGHHRETLGITVRR